MNELIKIEKPAVSREYVSEKLVDILEAEKKPAVNIILQTIKILIDLHGLALPKALPQKELVEMTRKELKKFIKANENQVIDITPEVEPTPRGGAELKTENVDKVARKNFEKTETCAKEEYEYL